MATLGPLIFFVSWPWIWFDTGARLAAYAAFHLHHVYYNMAYFGVNYFQPPFPASYAFVMTSVHGSAHHHGAGAHRHRRARACPVAERTRNALDAAQQPAGRCARHGRALARLGARAVRGVPACRARPSSAAPSTGSRPTRSCVCSQAMQRCYVVVSIESRLISRGLVERRPSRSSP